MLEKKFSAYYLWTVHLHYFTKIKSKKKKSQHKRNQGFSYYFCLMIEGSGSVRIRIQEAQKHTDPTDRDPQHCLQRCLKSKCIQAILAESRVVDVLMSCAMSVAERCRVDTPQGLAVEPGREEPTLKVSSDSFFLIKR
jgi:hypothetical protein